MIVSPPSVGERWAQWAGSETGSWLGGQRPQKDEAGRRAGTEVRSFIRFIGLQVQFDIFYS